MMTALTRQAKEMLVLDLYYNQNKTYRQITKEAKICPRDIKVIVDKKAKEVELSQSTSISSQAFSLFLQGKTPIQVAITLNLKEPEVRESCTNSIGIYNNYMIFIRSMKKLKIASSHLLNSTD